MTEARLTVIPSHCRLADGDGELVRFFGGGDSHSNRIAQVLCLVTDNISVKEIKCSGFNHAMGGGKGNDLYI